MQFIICRYLRLSEIICLCYNDKLSYNCMMMLHYCAIAIIRYYTMVLTMTILLHLYIAILYNDIKLLLHYYVMLCYYINMALFFRPMFCCYSLNATLDVSGHMFKINITSMHHLVCSTVEPHLLRTSTLKERDFSLLKQEPCYPNIVSRFLIFRKIHI